MKRYRLTESELRGVIREAVKNVLDEGRGIEKYTDDMYKDLEDSYKKERNNMHRADKRWQKSSDRRTLHRKGAAQRDLMDNTNESVLRGMIREAVKSVLNEGRFRYKGFTVANISKDPSFPMYGIFSPEGEQIETTMFPSELKEIVDAYLSGN